MIRNRPFFVIGLVGLAALVVGMSISLIVGQHAYASMEGYYSPTLAFEFMRNPEALHVLLALDPAKIEAMANSLYRDNIFIAVYTSFLVLFALQVRRLSGQRLYWILAAAALLIGFMDIQENAIQLHILRLYQENMRPPEMPNFDRLHLVSWAKWLLLPLYFLGFWSFLHRSNRLGQWLLWLTVAAFVVAIVGVSGSVRGAEAYAMMVMLVLFPAFILFCFMYRKNASA